MKIESGEGTLDFSGFESQSSESKYGLGPTCLQCLVTARRSSVSLEYKTNCLTIAKQKFAYIIPYIYKTCKYSKEPGMPRTFVIIVILILWWVDQVCTGAKVIEVGA